MPLIRSASLNLLMEILIRIALLSSFCYMEGMSPFYRVIQPAQLQGELHYPRRDSYVPSSMLWSLVLSVPCLLSLFAWAICNDCNDALEILLAWSLALGLTGFLTNTMKLIVGRPRPDYFFRCFPDGLRQPECTGEPRDIDDGRKSFPSGHSSLSFCSLGVCSLWVCGRLGAARRGGGGARLVAAGAPLVLALCVALSRTCDYHHHWQDVLVGSLLGFGMAALSYRQYYNPLTSDLSGVPVAVSSVTKYVNGKPDVSPLKCDGGKREQESTPLLKKDDKWI